MVLVGLIAEYNPFHLGHAYQIAQIKRVIPQADLAVLMSGNVVQRGEFAAVDKWTRAQMALEAGADLVLELPTIASMQSADYFAMLGVGLLAKIGCQALAFGTETQEVSALMAYADWRQQHQALIDRALRLKMKQGLAYPAALTQAILSLRADWPFDVASPNNMLAVQYLNANASLAHPMQVYAIPRLTEWQGKKLQSGSQIRQAWTKGDLSQTSLSQPHQDMLRQQPLIQWSDYWRLLFYQLNILSLSDLERIFGVEEGLAFKLKQVGRSAQNYSMLLDSLTSKRWTQARIQRILMAVLLGLDKEQAHKQKQLMQRHPLVRVLAMNTQGRQRLQLLKTQTAVSCFSNLKQGLVEGYELTLTADRVLAMNPQQGIPEQNLARYPIMK